MQKAEIFVDMISRAKYLAKYCVNNIYRSFWEILASLLENVQRRSLRSNNNQLN